MATIGCKLPNGLHLDHGGKRVTLNGANSAAVIGGHGITENVDAAFFEAWLEAHKDFGPVKAGLIFAHEKKSNAEAECNDKTETKSGLEGLDGEKPGRGIKKATTD